MDSGEEEKNFSRIFVDYFRKLFYRQWFPYDFRGEQIMSLVKHIVARCEMNTRLSDEMSETLSALLIKLTGLSQHEEEMKSQKQLLNEVTKLFNCTTMKITVISILGCN